MNSLAKTPTVSSSDQVCSYLSHNSDELLSEKAKIPKFSTFYTFSPQMKIRNLIKQHFIVKSLFYPFIPDLYEEILNVLPRYFSVNLTIFIIFLKILCSVS